MASISTATALDRLSVRLRRAGVTPRYASAECELGHRVAEGMLAGRGFYLHGSVGSGKTHALMAGVRELVGAGKAVRLTTFAALLEQETASFASNGGDGYSWLDDARRKPFLMLDELGEGKPTEWAVSQLYRVVDYRYQLGLPLSCASNLTLPELGRRLSAGGDTAGARIVSRLYEMCEQVSVEGPDRRTGAAHGRP